MPNRMIEQSNPKLIKTEQAPTNRTQTSLPRKITLRLFGCILFLPLSERRAIPGENLLVL
jgi:hypothetical protein